MRGSIVTKFGRLVWYLAANPKTAVRYFRNLRSSTLDLRMPWTSYRAIDYLKSITKPGTKVLEFGSGGSTLFFLDHGAHVTSTETDRKWIEYVRGRIPEGMQDRFVGVALEPDPKNSSLAYLDFIAKTPISEFDIIFIDHPDVEPDFSERPLIFNAVQPLLKRGAVVVVDDSWRYDHLKVENSAKFTRVLRSVGPGRPGVTEALACQF